MSTHLDEPDTARAGSELLDVTTAADYLGTPVRFVRRLVAQRRIRFYKIGRYVRIHRADLDRFIAEGCVEPGEPGGMTMDESRRARSPRI